MRQHGGEGIVSKRAASPYRGGRSRDWLKTKVSETGAFVITGFIEREAVAVAELRGAGAGWAGAVWPRWQGSHGSGSSRCATAPRPRSGLIPVRPELVAELKFFGRYRGGWIRDGVLLSVG